MKDKIEYDSVVGRRIAETGWRQSVNAILKTMMIVGLQVVAVSFTPACNASTNIDGDIVVVEYDGKSEISFGAMPSRAATANYVERIKAGRPKAIVLKFFYDTVGIEADNLALEKSLAAANVFLQASLDTEPPTSTHLDERFFWNGDIGQHKIELKGAVGWLPLKQFSSRASKVCFVNVRRPELIPMLVEFRGRPVPSMYACILAEVFNSGVIDIQKDRAIFGKYSLPIDTRAEAKVSLKDLDGGRSISVSELLARDFDSSVFAGKLVVLTYTGSRSPLISIGNASYKVHNVFLSQMRGLIELLVPVKSPFEKMLGYFPNSGSL